MTTFLSRSELWNWSSPVWLVALAIGVGYCVMNSGPRRWGWLLAGLATLVAAFVSPIGVLADGYLFSAHMVQHLLLLLVVPICLLLALPERPQHSRAAATPPAWFERLPAWPVLAWLSGIGAMWVWHVPSLCNAATQNSALGLLRSSTFLLAGLAFWWPIYGPHHSSRLRPSSAVVYLFSACLGCTLLGIYLTFTTISVCPAFASPADRIGILKALYGAGLTPAADQQLGGLLMWVPPCSLYVCAIISVLCRWYAAEDSAPTTNVPHEIQPLTGASS